MKTFFNVLNLSTGEYWTDHEVAAVTTVTEAQIATWREWTQNYMVANPGVKFSALLAARFAAVPDDRPLAVGEYWKVTPFGRVRTKETAQVDTAGVSLDTISAKLDRVVAKLGA